MLLNLANGALKMKPEKPKFAEGTGTVSIANFEGDNKDVY